MHTRSFALIMAVGEEQRRGLASAVADRAATGRRFGAARRLRCADSPPKRDRQQLTAPRLLFLRPSAGAVLLGAAEARPLALRLQRGLLQVSSSSFFGQQQWGQRAQQQQQQQQQPQAQQQAGAFRVTAVPQGASVQGATRPGAANEVLGYYLESGPAPGAADGAKPDARAYRAFGAGAVATPTGTYPLHAGPWLWRETDTIYNQEAGVPRDFDATLHANLVPQGLPLGASAGARAGDVRKW
jgi:hypothetical protein